MGFDVSPEVKMILNTKREFVREEIIPLERYFLNHQFDTLMPLLEEKRQKAKSLGLWLPQIPMAFGGMGLSLVEHAFVSEVLGQSMLGHYVFNCQAPDAGNMEILIEYGSAEQQERFSYLPRYCLRMGSIPSSVKSSINGISQRLSRLRLTSSLSPRKTNQ